MKNFQLPLVAALSALLVIAPITGCTVSQAKINTVVDDIATYAPIIANDAATLSTVAQSFDPADAVLIQQSVVTIQKDSAFLETLCAQYKANPSSSVLTQIASLVSEIATTDSNALLAVLQVKNPQSLATAKTILAAVATSVTILGAYLASVNVAVTPAASTSIKTMAPYVKKSVMVSELDKVKSQGLVPQNTTLQQLGF